MSYLHFVVPTPRVKITIFDDQLIIDNPLTLDCTATFARGFSSLVEIIWTTGGRVVRRVDNITADVENDHAIYTDSFEISSLSAIDNGIEYKCRVVINTRQPVYNEDRITLTFPGKYRVTTTPAKFFPL